MGFFVCSILMYLVQNFANKRFSSRVGDASTGVSLVQNGICVLTSSLCLLIIFGGKLMPAPLMLLAVAFGATYLMTVFFLLKSFSYGSVGGSTLVTNAGNFISAAYGIIKFGDKFTPFIAVGAVLLLAAIILCTPKITGNKSTVRWLVLAVAAGLSNGAVTSVKREAVAQYDNVQNFLMWGFLFAGIIAVSVLLIGAPYRRKAIPIVKQPSLVLCGAIAGIGTVGANLFQMFALQNVSSAILYPLAAGCLVVSIYKAVKMTWKNICSIVCCVAAIVLVNLK